MSAIEPSPQYGGKTWFSQMLSWIKKFITVHPKQASRLGNTFKYRAERHGERFQEDPLWAEGFVRQAQRKAEANEWEFRKTRYTLEKIWENLQALIRLIEAWLRDEYREIPWQTFIFALFAVVYFVNPIDVILDAIPGGGFIDDAAVIGIVIFFIQEDLECFKDWEERNGRNQ